ncbi:MAG: glycosyltransferase family 2 protein [Thermoleophilia bacterium]|nr:glycosyltransferase family 2 protein [Thermoleophilia bacterium]
MRENHIPAKAEDDIINGYQIPKVDIVVPVLNEIETLPGFLERIDALKLSPNLIVVDNGSTDGTLEFLASWGEITVIAHGENLGYGQSLIDGLMASTADGVIIIDADCEYPPEAIPAILDALADHDLVYASRFLDGAGIDMSRSRVWGNRFLTFLFNLLYHQRLTDLYTGMKGMRRQVLDTLTFERSGFEHVVELAAKASRHGFRIIEIPVEYAPRQSGRSKMRHVPEFFKAVYCLMNFRLVPDKPTRM